jgi:competence protein ComEC
VVVVPLSLLGTLLLPVSDAAAGVAWSAAAGAMDLLWTGLGAIAPTVAASHWVPPPSTASLLLAVLGIAIVLLPRGLPWRHAGWLLVLPMLVPRDVAPARGVDAIALALPRGDAVLLRSAAGTVLVDAGPADAGLVEALRALGVARIDLRIETRGNAGRRGGIAAVDAAFPPAAVWRSPSVDPASPAAGPGPRCEAGRAAAFDGFVIEALHPSPGLVRRDPDGACVLRVRFGGQVLWLASDAGPWVARRLAARVDPAPGQRALHVWGGPPALAAWRQALGADAALATRAPGPARSRGWAREVPRVDRDGSQVLRVVDGGPTPRPGPLRSRGRRWWDGPPP